MVLRLSWSRLTEDDLQRCCEHYQSLEAPLPALGLQNQSLVLQFLLHQRSPLSKNERYLEALCQSFIPDKADSLERANWEGPCESWFWRRRFNCFKAVADEMMKECVYLVPDRSIFTFYYHSFTYALIMLFTHSHSAICPQKDGGYVDTCAYM